MGGWLAFLAGGPSRLHALAVNFAAYALLQAVVVVVLNRLAGWPAALLGWGLTWTLRTVYLPAGGIADFRADFAALCLFAVWLRPAPRAVARSRPRAGAALAGARGGRLRVGALPHDRPPGGPSWLVFAWRSSGCASDARGAMRSRSRHERAGATRPPAAS